jgi:GrpB-like predicted nucleotidyltransferase (UPF0157 family)
LSLVNSREQVPYVIHVVLFNGEIWSELIQFRDYLNENTNAAREYEMLKRELAKNYPNDEMAYTLGKEEFVNKIISKQD